MGKLGKVGGGRDRLPHTEAACFWDHLRAGAIQLARLDRLTHAGVPHAVRSVRPYTRPITGGAVGARRVRWSGDSNSLARTTWLRGAERTPAAPQPILPAAELQDAE